MTQESLEGYEWSFGAYQPLGRAHQVGGAPSERALRRTPYCSRF
jgi:hypothetical protein